MDLLIINPFPSSEGVRHHCSFSTQASGLFTERYHCDIKAKATVLKRHDTIFGLEKNSPWESPNSHIWLFTVETNIITLIVLRLIRSYIILNLRVHWCLKDSTCQTRQSSPKSKVSAICLCLRASPYLSFLKTVLLGWVALVIKMKDLKGHCKTQHPKL